MAGRQVCAQRHLSHSSPFAPRGRRPASSAPSLSVAGCPLTSCCASSLPSGRYLPSSRSLQTVRREARNLDLASSS